MDNEEKKENIFLKPFHVENLFPGLLLRFTALAILIVVLIIACIDWLCTGMVAHQSPYNQEHWKDIGIFIGCVFKGGIAIGFELITAYIWTMRKSPYHWTKCCLITVGYWLLFCAI